MTVKSKFKAGDIIYYKYPSRYSRTRDTNTVEVILQIKQIEPNAYGPATSLYDTIILKTIRGDFMKTGTVVLAGSGRFLLDILSTDTYSRHLTPAEKVLYG